MLKELYSFDSVSHKSMVVCECGWETQARSASRGREQHNDHKQAVLDGRWHAVPTSPRASGPEDGKK